MRLRVTWRRWLSVALAVLLTATIVTFINITRANADTIQNADPIILVTGFGGWGRNELYGYKYFGGFDDIQQNLQNKGYTVLVG